MTDSTGLDPLAWLALGLGVTLIVVVIGLGAWLYVRGRALAKATRLAEELKRAAGKAEEKERLRATPDLGPLVRGPERRGPVPSDR